MHAATERQMLCDITYMWVCKSQTQRIRGQNGGYQEQKERNENQRNYYRDVVKEYKASFRYVRSRDLLDIMVSIARKNDLSTQKCLGVQFKYKHKTVKNEVVYSSADVQCSISK